MLETTNAKSEVRTARIANGIDALGDLFPLPLVPFEAMALYDNWPDYPMSCGAIFTMQGKIDPAAFAASVAKAVARHPLVQAQLVPMGKRGWRWVPKDHPMPIQWLGEADADEFAACRPFDLQSEGGIRIWVQQRADVAKIFVEFHHSTCDGAGGMSFFDDIFATYAAIVNGVEDDLPPIDLALLKERGTFAPECGTRRRRLANGLIDLASSASLALRRPLTLADAGRSKFLSRQTWTRQRMVSRSLGKDASQLLRSAAAEYGVTLNDYLVSRLFQTLRRWNSEHRPDEKGWLRVLIPVNLRNRRDLQLPLTNRLSYGFITRRTDRLDDTSLVQSIAAENVRLRRIGLPRRLLQKFALMHRTGLWALVFTPRRCLATAVFSNLGDPTRRFRKRFPRTDGQIQIGNLRMTAFEGTTALRPLTRAGIFFNTYAGQLTISTRFDPNYYTLADAESFLDLFSQQIMDTTKEKSQKRAA